MIRKLMAAAALLSMSVGALADGTYEFASITRLTNTGYSITGVLVNDTAPTTLAVNQVTSQCFSWLELMMKSPEVYILTVTVTTPQPPALPITSLSSCVLAVKP